MPDSSPFGRLEAVPLREHWPSEAGDFTPWLATTENLRLLSETVGMDLEIEDTEVRVGPFRADILCRDSATDRYVLIENQLERTDHTHLGQLLTYAAGLDAAAILWIAKTFTDEHRQALDWLNEITGEHFHFFGIEVELWRIGDSAPAPRMNVVARPNDWQKAVRAVERKSSSERATMYREVWTALTEHLTRKDLPSELPQPGGMNQLRIPLPDGRLVFGYSAKNRSMSVYALVRGADRPTLYRLLKENGEHLQSLLGMPLEWIDYEDDGYGKFSFPYDHEDPSSVEAGADIVANTVTLLFESFAACSARAARADLDG